MGTGIHTLLMVGIFPLTNMPPTLKNLCPLHCYGSPYMDPTLLLISLKKKHTTIFISHPITKNVPARNMAMKCQRCKLVHRHIRGNYTIICAIYKTPSTAIMIYILCNITTFAEFLNFKISRSMENLEILETCNSENCGNT